jgi:hypothetical protein
LGEPVVVGLDGGYVRSRHRQDERHFEVIAGKVIDAQGSPSCFAFARNSPAVASGAFKQALVVAGVTPDTPATMLCDGMAGLQHHCGALRRSSRYAGAQSQDPFRR